MNCKSCNTRVPAGKQTCPHCGHAQPKSRFIDQPVERDTPPEESSPGPLSPSMLADESMRADDTNADSAHRNEGESVDDDAVELPLEEAMAMGSGKSSGKKKAAKKARVTPGASSSGTERPDRRRVERRRAAGRRTVDRPQGEAPAGALPMDADQLRHLIGEHPELLESGLRVLGEEGRRQLGIGYGTEVGEIDLLARTESGDWVVVMVAANNPGPQAVSDVLHRVGWVRKHLCEEGESVRAILLLDRVDDELGYAAAAVADTVSFKTWKVSIRFDSVEV